MFYLQVQAFTKKLCIRLTYVKLLLDFKVKFLEKRIEACGRRTDMQSVFLLKLKALGTLDRRAHHLSYQGGPKSPPHIFFVLTNLD